MEKREQVWKGRIENCRESKHAEKNVEKYQKVENGWKVRKRCEEMYKKCKNKSVELWKECGRCLRKVWEGCGESLGTQSIAGWMDGKLCLHG